MMMTVQFIVKAKLPFFQKPRKAKIPRNPRNRVASFFFIGNNIIEETAGNMKCSPDGHTMYTVVPKSF